MQRVAIARALVNNPDIILADEPTGALDTKTSIQVMEILKEISKDKLIIMVTHNPELAEKYSSRIIKILDGEITEDSNPIIKNEVKEEKRTSNIGKTSMKFWTAFRLSLNNLLTKKGRTVLVAFAGSIGIIGIALIQAVSNGFQNYVDHIQEEALTSYPLTIMQETSDITGTLLAMTSKTGESDNTGTVKEEQYMSTMLGNLSANDLKSFKNYLEDNYDEVSNDIANVKYSYSVDPNIYTKDATGKIAKLNPSNLFSSVMGSSSMLSSYSSYTSIYSQMIDNQETLNESYDVLAGAWPQEYNEMIIVLSEPNKISDLLIYSLGLRDTDELTEIVTKIMSGESVEINNEPMTLSYEDLMNIELKLIRPTDKYKYNSKYKLYEDMSEDEDYLEDLYNDAIELKIVGIVSPKEGVTSMALNSGVAYTSKLVDYIIDYSADTDIVKKQLENEEVDVLSGSRFDAKKNDLNLDFQDLVTVDSQKLKSAFNITIDQDAMQKQTEGCMTEISNTITTDITPAKEAFDEALKTLSTGAINSINKDTDLTDTSKIVDKYLETSEAVTVLKNLETKYVIPKETFKTTFSGFLNTLLPIYVSTLQATTNTGGTTTNIVSINADELKESIVSEFLNNTAIQTTSETMAKAMTEAVMKKTILSKVGELMNNVTSSLASAFKVDQNKIADSFKLKMTEEEITRIVTAMMSKTESNCKTNLISLGYQDKEEPTYISFYFNSFDGKEHFMNFIDEYNEKVKAEGQEDKEINYTDTTGILMSSVKTIVNAVTYVLIAFVSISLVVSSIMIGIITYISVYERTKEIGILRAIGASKHNISSIFNAETFIIGLLSGLFGIGITYALIPIINNILHHFTGNIPLSAALNPSNAITLVVLSVILTLIGGLIPAKAASKKDPVIALRTE